MKHIMTVADWHPPLLNKTVGRHWTVKNKLKQKATEMLTVMARQHGIPPATGKRRVAITLHGWLKGRLPDRDGWDKLTLDALVRSGLLIDDGPDWLEGRMEVRYVRSENKLTVITLEDVA